MEKTTVTKRDRFEEIRDLAVLAQENGFEGFDFDGIVEFCDKEVVALDNKNAKAKERAAKKRAEGDALTGIVLDELTDELETIAEIALRVASREGCEDVTAGKVQYRLNALAKEGKITKGEITIAATETTKKATKVAYSL